MAEFVKLDKTVKWLGETLEIYFSSYSVDGSTCIQLRNMSGDDFARVTTCCPDAEFNRASCVLIKNYSENEGIDNVFVESGIIDKWPIKTVTSGHATIPVYKLLEKPDNFINMYIQTSFAFVVPPEESNK